MEKGKHLDLCVNASLEVLQGASCDESADELSDFLLLVEKHVEGSFSIDCNELRKE